MLLILEWKAVYENCADGDVYIYPRKNETSGQLLLLKLLLLLVVVLLITNCLTLKLSIGTGRVIILL